MKSTSTPSSTEKITQLLSQMHLEYQYSETTEESTGSSTHVVDVSHNHTNNKNRTQFQEPNVSTRPIPHYYHVPPPMAIGTRLTRAQENELWRMGYESHKRGEYELAMSQFYPICHYAKVAVNMGIISSSLNDTDNALLWYHYAVELDPYLTAAWLQLGFMYFVQFRDEEALYCFDQAFLTLRGNDFVDYSLSGMPYKIYKCELHYNRSMCLDQLGRANQAYRELVSGARSAKTKEHVDVIVRLAQHGFESVQDIVLFCIPKDLVFGLKSFMTSTNQDSNNMSAASPDPRGDIFVEDMGTPSVYSTLTSISSTKSSTSSKKDRDQSSPSSSAASMTPHDKTDTFQSDTLESRLSPPIRTISRKNWTLSSQRSASSSKHQYVADQTQGSPFMSSTSPVLKSRRSNSSFRFSFLTKRSNKTFESSSSSANDDSRRSISSLTRLSMRVDDQDDDTDERPFHQAQYEAPGNISLPRPPEYKSQD